MTKLSLANTYHDLPLEKVRKMVGETVVAAHPRIDTSSLDKVVQRIGITVKELATAPNLDDHPWIEETGTLAFRTLGPWS
jgi:hypothetical protein